MKIEQTSRNVLTVRFSDISSGWEYWILLRSDAHHDHKRCNRRLEKKHLDMVVERGGMWFSFGDLFDAMQGKFDPRRSYDEIRPEDVVQDYYGSIVRHAAEFYGPYAKQCGLLARGNHESSTVKNAGTDLTSNLAFHLNTEYLADDDYHIYTGCFGGWVRLMFTINQTIRRTIRLKYFHGAGASAAPVTKGVIQTARQAVFLPDADIVVNGHNHQSYILPIATERLSRAGGVTRGIQWHGRIPGYKDDYGDGGDGFAVEKGHPPNPLGALWLHLVCDDHDIRHTLVPEIR